jgi:hypothetical protein
MIDPFTLSLIASGVQTGIGALQSAGAAKKRNEAISKLEKLAANSPLQKESKTLNDYYQESLNRYRENPFTTPYYLENLKQSERAATQALGALQTRGVAIGGTSRINRILQDAKNRGVAGAMQNKNVQFGQLGSATQMKRAEERELFDINKMTPYNRRLQLQQMAAEGYTSDKAAYDQAVQSGLGNAATALMYKGMYKTPKPPIDFTNQINASKAQFEIDRANLPKINPNYRSNYRGLYKDSYFPMTDYSNLV